MDSNLITFWSLLMSSPSFPKVHHRTPGAPVCSAVNCQDFGAGGRRGRDLGDESHQHQSGAEAGRVTFGVNTLW